jgi:hypothetical protein
VFFYFLTLPGGEVDHVTCSTTLDFVNHCSPCICSLVSSFIPLPYQAEKWSRSIMQACHLAEIERFEARDSDTDDDDDDVDGNGKRRQSTEANSDKPRILIQVRFFYSRTNGIQIIFLSRFSVSLS